MPCDLSSVPWPTDIPGGTVALPCPGVRLSGAVRAGLTFPFCRSWAGLLGGTGPCARVRLSVCPAAADVRAPHLGGVREMMLLSPRRCHILLKDTLVRANATHVTQQGRIGPRSNYFRFPHLLFCPSQITWAPVSAQTLLPLQLWARCRQQDVPTSSSKVSVTTHIFLASNRSISNARVIKKESKAPQDGGVNWVIIYLTCVSIWCREVCASPHCFK